jgi:hypothetical protein
MKNFVLKLATIGFGLLLSSLILLIVEGLFRINHNYQWIKSPYVTDTDDFDPIDSEKSQEVSDCLPNHYAPFWRGGESCGTKVILKRKSNKTVFDAYYSFNKNGLRNIPSAVENERFLLFLGCSFTFGEGQNDKDIFANLITKKLKPMNAYNLGMTGYGPNTVLRLLERNNDKRFIDIKGKDGIAIYTYIDHHLLRLIGAMSIMKMKRFWGHYYSLEKGMLKYNGTFLLGRPLMTKFYYFLGQSAIIDYFGLDLPIIGESEIDLFVSVMLEMKKRVKEIFKVDKFIVSIYPGENKFSSLFKTKLEKEGIYVFDFSNIDINKMFHGQEKITGNDHPSQLGHRFYSELVVSEIKKQKLL